MYQNKNQNIQRQPQQSSFTNRPYTNNPPAQHPSQLPLNNNGYSSVPPPPPPPPFSQYSQYSHFSQPLPNISNSTNEYDYRYDGYDNSNNFNSNNNSVSNNDSNGARGNRYYEMRQNQERQKTGDDESVNTITRKPKNIKNGDRQVSPSARASISPQ